MIIGTNTNRHKQEQFLVQVWVKGVLYLVLLRRHGKNMMVCVNVHRLYLTEWEPKVGGVSKHKVDAKTAIAHAKKIAR